MTSDSSKKSFPLHVWIKGKPVLRFAPSLPRPATVSDVRSAIAEEMKEDPRFLTLEQWVASDLNGNVCVQVCDSEDKMVPFHSEQAEFGLESGAIRSKSAVALPDCVTVLHSDKDIIHLVNGRRSVINVYKQDRANVTILLHIRNNGGINFALSPTLQPTVTVGEIRNIIATDLKVKPKFIKLDRFVGRTHQGNTCIRVSDEAGRVVGIGDDAATFADTNGNVYLKDRLESYKLVTLDHDDEPFIHTLGRSNVINVTQSHLKSYKLYVVVQHAEIQNFPYDPLLPDHASVEEIRVAISAKLGVEPNYLKMEQWIGVTPQGEECVQVCNENDEFVGISLDSAEFQDFKGKVYTKDRTIEEHEQVLYNNGAAFKQAPGRRTIVNVGKMNSSQVILPLYISNCCGPDFAMTIVVPRKVKVREVRTAISMEFKLKPSLVKLERWTGKSSFTLPVYQVCNSDGEFLSIRNDKGEFGDTDGDIYKKGNFKDTSEVELKDDERFDIIPNRTSVINFTTI